MQSKKKSKNLDDRKYTLAVSVGLVIEFNHFIFSPNSYLKMLMTEIFTFCVLLLLMSLPYEGESHLRTNSTSCPVHINGCSIPCGLPFVYKTKFTPACNKHDVCYSCVSGNLSVTLFRFVGKRLYYLLLTTRSVPKITPPYQAFTRMRSYLSTL